MVRRGTNSRYAEIKAAVKNTLDSTEIDVQEPTVEDPAFSENIPGQTTLNSILDELKKMNLYLAHITNMYISGEDI